jgi:hypothetical protein
MLWLPVLVGMRIAELAGHLLASKDTLPDSKFDIACWAPKLAQLAPFMDILAGTNGSRTDKRPSLRGPEITI